MYQRILVPVDGSPTSQLGLAEAIELAKLTGGQLRLLHMVDVLSIATGMGTYPMPTVDFFAYMRESGQKILDEAREQAANQGVTTEVILNEVHSGRLADLVVEQALAWPADLVVLGTHGRRGVGRILLGSDAEQIVRIAPVPVLLVRGRAGT
jgi:nucleotide-binding universal stress UspA family protein